jgi:hypothetical protein
MTGNREHRVNRNGKRVSGEMGNFDVSMTFQPMFVTASEETAFLYTISARKRPFSAIYHISTPLFCRPIPFKKKKKAFLELFCRICRAGREHSASPIPTSVF